MRTLAPPAISTPVRLRPFSKTLSKHAPTIVVISLCISLVTSWIGAPAWLPNGLAVIVAGLALLLFASRRPRHQFTTLEESDAHRSWIAYELAGQGTPAGHYLLGFFGIVTIVLTGFGSPYAMLAWAGFALGVVWGIVNARYPTGGSDN